MARHTYDFDLVTLGAGSGGTRASRFSAQKYGAKVAVVELPFGFISSDEIGGAGGTCVIRGCVPKKLMVYGSAFSEEYSDGGGFGWKVAKPEFDWKVLMGKKTAEIQRLNGVYNKLLANAGVELIEGRGVLKDAHTVEVALASGGTRTLTADKILLAVGGKPVKAPIEGSEHAITSDEVLALPDLPTPRRIVAVGAGYIAIEFASMFNGFGMDVHLMFRKDLPLTGFDQECRHKVAENLQQRGLHLHPETSPTKITKNEDGSFSVSYKDSTGEHRLDGVGLVVFGTGRSPNTKNIGLEGVGVGMGKDRSVIVDEYSRTSAPNIYAIGDVTNRLNLTPVAIMEGMAFATTAFGGAPTKPIHERVASAVFTQPPLATVGLSEEAAIDSLAGDIDIFTSSFRPMKNTVSGREEKSFMKIIVHVQTDEVVGVHMVGPDAPEIMQGIGIAVKCKATKAQFDSTVGIHPTAAEEIVTMRTRSRRVQGKAAREPDSNESRSLNQE